MTVSALSIKQPWAWAITDLDKRIENRSHRTLFRGELFLHASAEGDSRGMGALYEILTDAERQRMPMDGPACGAIVGVARLVECMAPPPGTQARGCTAGQARWAERASFWWVLDQEVIRLPVPVPCKGKLGIWTVPPDVEAAVRRQMEMARKKTDAEKAPLAPPAAAAKGAEDPKANSPEDLGYSKTKGKKARLKPDEREEVLRLSGLVCEAKRDLARAVEAKKQASQPAKEAAARLKKYMDQLDAVESGNWQPGMFSNDGAADGDGSED